MSRERLGGRARRVALLGLGLAALIGFAVSAYSLFTVASEAQIQGGTRLTDPPLITDVPLLAGDGSVAELSDWQGRYRVIFFGCTSCPDVCPLTMSRLAQLYRDLGEPSGLQILMVSVDPVRDTPERMQEYVGTFHPSFVGLTGTSSSIGRAVKQFYDAVNQIGDDDLSHTSSLMLLDLAGRFTAVYSDGDLAALEADLRRLLQLGAG